MNTDPVLIDPSRERVVLDFRTLGFHDVIVLGRYDYSSARPGLAMHRHAHMIEICLLDKGTQIYITEGHKYTLSSGDLFVTYPNELHGTGGHPEEKGTLYWCILNVPKPQERFLSLDPPDWHVVLSPLLNRRPRQFPSTPAVKMALDQIIAVYHDASDPMRKVNLQNWMLRFLLETISCATSPVDRLPSPLMQAVLKAIDENIGSETDISLKELASIAGLSLSRFKSRFRAEIGMPPAEFVTRRKVQKASEWLLQTDWPITDISTRLGFSTSQYFATVYKRFTGKNPSLVRNSRESS